MHVCTHRITLMVSHRHTKARMESYTHRYTGMHTYMQSHTYNSHIHVCMYAHIESYTWSHTDTHKGTHGVLHTHTSRGMLVTGEKSFLRASPSPSISPSLTLDPSLLPSPGHQLWFHQQEHKSWICQAGLIPRGVETAQGSEENSGVRAGQCCAETPSPAAPGSCRGHWQAVWLYQMESTTSQGGCDVRVGTHRHHEALATHRSARWQPTLSSPSCSHKYSSALWSPG